MDEKRENDVEKNDDDRRKEYCCRQRLKKEASLLQQWLFEGPSDMWEAPIDQCKANGVAGEDWKRIKKGLSNY